MRSLVLFLLFLAILSGCRRDTEIQQIKNVFLQDLAYGDNPYQKLDAYLPAKRDSATPVMIFIHGGGWIGGDKKDFSTIAESFSKRGYATFSINYRLANNSCNYISLNQDIASAISFIRSRHNDFYISQDKFALFGHSAGAHLAMLHAFKNDSAGQIKAVISAAGPSNLCNPSHTYLQPVIETYNHSTYASAPLLWKDNSPFYFVSSTSPAVYLLHGTNDSIVDINDSRALYSKLDSLGVRCFLKELPTDHVGILYMSQTHYEALSNWILDVLSKK